MKTPLVSICIPVYNHEAYVTACVDSVLAQDYPCIELIAIDDGSSDRSWERLQELRARCERRFVRTVFITRPNRGRAATCQELLSQARGELVGFIASDDMYLPAAVSLLVRAFEDDDGLGLAVGRNLLIDGDGRECWWNAGRECVYCENEACYRSLDEWIERQTGVGMGSPSFGSYDALFSANHVPNGSLQRLDMVRAVGGYAPNVPLEDWWLHLQLSKVAKYRHIGADTFLYRWHGANSVMDRRRIWRQERSTLKCEIRRSGFRFAGIRPLWILLCPIFVRLLIVRMKGALSWL